MEAKKGGRQKKNSSRNSNNSAGSRDSSCSSISSSSSNSSKSKTKRKSIRKRSRSLSQKKFKKTYKNRSKLKANTIKSSIFGSSTLKTDFNNKKFPLIAQANPQNKVMPMNTNINVSSAQSEIISSSSNLNKLPNVEKEIPVSYEGFKNKAITEDFKDIPYYFEESNEFSLFEKKEETENNLETNIYSIEKLLLMDQTNKKLQKKYISIAIDLFNSEKEKEKIEILKEKIKKAGIILDEDVYNNEIIKIKNLEFNQNFEYINYRNKFFETLKYILDKESNLIEAKNRLKIEKIYQFNQPAELGNNNYYFYGLCTQLRNKMNEIFMRYNLYTKFIPYFIEFTQEKNLNNLTKNEKFLFNYQLEILLDEESIANENELKKVMNFLKGKKVHENEVIKAVKSSKTNNNLNYSKIQTMNYELSYNKNSRELNFLIKEQRKLYRKIHNFNKTYSYKIDNFNKKIIKIIKKEFDHNIESKLFENVLPNVDNIDEVLKDFRPEFNRIIKCILSSKAAENFFNAHYKDKYKNLNYHFNRKKVQEKILEGIMFAPLFNKVDNAITNPIDLSIIINSTPGNFRSDNIPIFNRKILILGQYILFGIHEILGHYCRRYYSYFTGQKININTKGDNEIKTGNESGFYVETEFLGITNKSALTLTQALSFFYWKKYDSYPIIEKNSNFEVDEDKIKILIENNENIFNFVKIKDDEDDNKITIQEYLELISYSSNSSKSDIYSRIHCPSYSNEDYIYWY